MLNDLVDWTPENALDFFLTCLALEYLELLVQLHVRLFRLLDFQAFV